MRQYVTLGLIFFSLVLKAQDRMQQIKDEFKSRKSSIESKFYNKDFNTVKEEYSAELANLSLDPEKAQKNEYVVHLSDRDKIVGEANKYIGVPYLWGGNTPDAFDCSGLVQWVIKKSYGINIPRTTNLQYTTWKNNMVKSTSDLKKGDLIYFKTVGKTPVSHVGIYLGNNEFIHAPNKKEKVKKSKLKGYWKERYVGFIPINTILTDET